MKSFLIALALRLKPFESLPFFLAEAALQAFQIPRPEVVAI